MIEPVINAIIDFIFSDNIVFVLISAFVIVIGLTMYGIKRMEEN